MLTDADGQDRPYTRFPGTGQYRGTVFVVALAVQMRVGIDQQREPPAKRIVSLAGLRKDRPRGVQDVAENSRSRCRCATASAPLQYRALRSGSLWCCGQLRQARGGS